MSVSSEQLSINGRRAISYGDWKMVNTCALEFIRREPSHPEGYFL